MSISRMACLRAALSVVALFAAEPASADVPQWLAGETVDGLAAASPYFYWASGCEDMTVPSRSRIRWMQPAPPGASPFLYLPRTLYETSCGPSQIASNIAVDGRYVYWIGADGFLLRLRRDGSARAEAISFVGPANGAGYSIAIANDWLVWSNGSGVYRKWAGFGLPGFFGAHPVVTPGTQLVRGLIATTNGYLLQWQDEVRRMVPVGEDGYRFATIHLANNITAFAVSGYDVFVAVRFSGGYQIKQFSQDGSGEQVLYETTHLGRVDQIAADGGAVYWHVADASGNGPLVRLRHRTAETPEIIAENLRMSPRSRLINSFFYLYWANYEGLVRLPSDGRGLRSL